MCVYVHVCLLLVASVSVYLDGFADERVTFGSGGSVKREGEHWASAGPSLFLAD